VSVFKHYNKKTPQPLMWATRLQSGVLEQHQPSASSQSLLHALLPGASVDMMLFTTPSAWAPLGLRKSVHGGPGVDFDVRSVRVKLTYDYSPSTGALWATHRDTQNTSLTSIYQGLLRRAPTAAELRSARELLDLGYTSAELTAHLSLQHEEEYMGEKVEDIYQLLYHRDPTAAEKAWWAKELADDRPELQVRSYVQLITDTFADIYNRTPSYLELQMYTQLLDDGIPL
jgi:hypothetical protein